MVMSFIQVYTLLSLLIVLQVVEIIDFVDNDGQMVRWIL